jgi:hypothetical protein
VNRIGTAALLGTGLLLGGCAVEQARLPEAASVARFYLEIGPGETGTPVALPVSGVALAVEPAPVLIESDLAAVSRARVDLGECLAVRFRPAAAADLLRLSTAARNRRLVLVVDGAPLGARRLDATLATGELLMFVEVPSTELPVLVRRLQSGIARLKKPASVPVRA